MRGSFFLAMLAVAPFVGCDKKPDAPATPAQPSASASTKASVSASSSSSAGAAGACATLAQEKAGRCEKLSAGDPTIRSACTEGIDGLLKAGDDTKCKAFMNPPPSSGSADPDPD